MTKKAQDKSPNQKNSHTTCDKIVNFLNVKRGPTNQ